MGKSFISLAVLLFAAFMMPIIVSKIKFFRLPVVLMEILIGVFIGKSCLNIVQTDPIIEFMPC